jgi:hypothetical protein
MDEIFANKPSELSPEASRAGWPVVFQLALEWVPVTQSSDKECSRVSTSKE